MAPKRSRLNRVVDRDKRVKITNEMISAPVKQPRYMPPYFAHEPLNPELYVGELAAPLVPVPNAGSLTYDIEADPGNGNADSGEESEIEESTDMMTRPPVQSSSNDNRIVVGSRPVEGNGRKLCAVEDMDEDDKLLFYLKLAKWSDRDIHNKFVCEGRINYNIKTLSSRFSRMRRFMMAENEKRLQEGTATWLKSEKKLLPDAVAFATKQIENFQKRKWELVSGYIQKHEPLAIYSGESCRQQYEEMIFEKGQGQTINQSKMAKFISGRQEQEALIEHFKRAGRPEKKEEGRRFELVTGTI